jgi:hypothetical protein
MRPRPVMREVCAVACPCCPLSLGRAIEPTHVGLGGFVNGVDSSTDTVGDKCDGVVGNGAGSKSNGGAGSGRISAGSSRAGGEWSTPSVNMAAPRMLVGSSGTRLEAPAREALGASVGRGGLLGNVDMV